MATNNTNKQLDFLWLGSLFRVFTIREIFSRRFSISIQDNQVLRGTVKQFTVIEVNLNDIWMYH
jgi:hypothetical protein